MQPRYSTKQENTLDKLTKLYQQMDQAYSQTAWQLGLSCRSCIQNCCTSYFQHHTYLEWAYLWRGLQGCAQNKKELYLQKANAYLEKSGYLLQNGIKPQIMCPLNENGWCGLYPYRLMICRLHGVPNQVTMPNQEIRHFPGCSKSQQLSAGMQSMPALDRTRFYSALAALEKEFTAQAHGSLPRVKLTLAEMLYKGPPRI